MSRLPTPGSDDGNWGVVLNDYLSHSLDSGGLLKAGSVGASQIQSNAVTAAAVADGALPEAKVQNLVTDLGMKVDTSDARLTDQSSSYPATAYGFFAVTTPVRLCNSAGSAITSPSLFLVRIWVPAGKAITAAAAQVTSSGTLGAGGSNGFAIYNDGGTLVAATPSNNNLWTSTGWASTAFSSPIAAQNTGRFVYIGLGVNGYSASPNFLFDNNDGNSIIGGIGGITRRHLMYDGSTSSFPASFNPASFGVTTNFLPLLGLG